MFATYEDSVLAAANDDGILSGADAAKLVEDHGLLPSDAISELGAVHWLEAETLLHFLGY